MSIRLKLGRWFGIELTADWSCTFLFAFVTWNLSEVFSTWHPAWNAETSLFVALIAAASFFASIVVHELAHALVARVFDTRVRRISLFLFGGVSNIEREPPSPYSEFIMALVGPLASFLLGIVFLLVGAALYTLDPLSSIFVWLGRMNIAIALFNLIPAFPLDGGRLLRATVWSITRDLQSATRWASSIGQAVGWSFVVLGIAMVFGAHVPFFSRGFVGGMWLAFIGLFLSLAAEQSYRRALVQNLLENISVEQVMHRNFMATPMGMGALKGLPRIGCEPCGAMHVSEIMTPASRLIVVAPEDDLETALGKLAQNGIEQLLVVTQGQLVGMLDRRDLARWNEIRQVEQRRIGSLRELI